MIRCTPRSTLFPYTTLFRSTNQNTSGGVTEVFIKKLYLEGAFNKLFVFRVGAYNGAWTSLVESNYGYRYIDKTTTEDRKSTRLNSSHTVISYAVFCLKKKNK